VGQRSARAAAKKGYLPVGLDPSLGAILAAKRVANGLGLPFHGVVGDARFLPFRAGSFDVVFSYSVLQHFSKRDARTALEDIRRVLHADGRSIDAAPGAARLQGRKTVGNGKAGASGGGETELEAAATTAAQRETA
jgi:ubiquinone/menaquinone biosynthesis C-methylase UbiE